MFGFENIQEKLVALNKVVTFLSSLSIALNLFSILESEINEFLPSANIVGVSLLELLKSSFIYLRNKRGSRMDPFGTPQVII